MQKSSKKSQSTQKSQIVLSETTIPDARKFNPGRKGGSTFSGRVAITMQKIGKPVGTLVKDLTNEELHEYWKVDSKLRYHSKKAQQL